MSLEYENEYYENLAELIIKYPSTPMANGEVCFYEGNAKTYTIDKEVKETPKKKHSLILTPWVVGIKRKTTVGITEKLHKNYYDGTFYLTNMRVIFKCPVNSFDYRITEVSSISHSDDEICVSIGKFKYFIVSKDIKTILHIIEMMNKAQRTPRRDTDTLLGNPKNISISRNDNYAIAAFIHYCNNGGKPVFKSVDDYPRYFSYDYKVNDPVKYHKKVIELGYLIEAPTNNSLKRLKVSELKKILSTHSLPDKGKKEELIARIEEGIDISTLNLEILYIPTEKGLEHLKKYEYIFKIKPYGINVDEFEAASKKVSKCLNTDDIIWQIINKKFITYNSSRDYELARAELYYKAIFLENEKNLTEALKHYILCLYYDMSGCGNNNHRYQKEDLRLAPHIVSMIYKHRDYYMEEMSEKCFDEYRLPYHYFSKESFETLINMIFEDETIDIQKL